MEPVAEDGAVVGVEGEIGGGFENGDALAQGAGLEHDGVARPAADDRLAEVEPGDQEARERVRVAGHGRLNGRHRGEGDGDGEHDDRGEEQRILDQHRAG